VTLTKQRNSIYIAPGKTGKARDVPLNAAGRALFQRMIAGRASADSVFLKDDGAPWAKSDQHRRMIEACETGKIEPRAVFHELRHTYASALVTAGVDMYRVAQLIGDSLKTTEKHYAHLRHDALADAVASLPDFGTASTNVRSLR
jgi:site-specific recombinase XerD